MRNLLLLAPPAAGKGTQAQLLKEKYGIVPISTGALLREAAKREDAFGKEIGEILESGKLVDDSIVISLLREHLQKLDGTSFLLDGFPRSLRQAEELDLLLEEIGEQLGYVFLLEVPKHVLEARIIGRRICSKCGKIYNVSEQNITTCPCGGALIARSDDTKEAYQVRYEYYLNSTYPLVGYYERKGLLYRIDANRPTEEVFKSISEILNRGEMDD